jgi:hypothetical protein
MKLTFRSDSWFPFDVPEKDATFASSVGPGTVYPVGYTLEQALQIYWRAKDYLVVASGHGSSGGVTQALAVNQNLPPRNAVVGTYTYYEVDGFTPRGPGDLVTGYGQRQILAGSGTISASGTSGSVLGLEHGHAERRRHARHRFRVRDVQRGDADRRVHVFRRLGAGVLRRAGGGRDADDFRRDHGGG